MADALVKTPATPKKNAFTSENSQSRLSNASLKEGSDSSAFSSRRQSRVGDNFTDRNALINLEVKVLTQSLGAENQWTECGDGLVEFSDMTIRVIAFKEEGKTEEKVLLEDTINSDTPFVGENCCIVWNSFEQQLSLCLMYASDEGYVASWSALVALQEKSYPPLQFDPLARCKPCKDENGKNLEVFPYSYYLHNKYTPPLGFIHMHAFSVAIMEYEHGRRPELYKNKDVVVTILSIANPELYEYLLDPEVYPLLVNGAIGEGVSPTKRRLKEWTVPGELGKVCASDEKKTQMAKELIGKDLRLSHLLRDILTPKVVSSEVIMRFSSISQADSE
ncbi:hypothetical protein AGDE_12787 [Angomonas deanei]|uniref:Uncharacterized protein n=1 Tax=Angomonas deanei TaxID=59799 RepID=A0A7G2CAB0_9TRYP|nr:hypothetical protein AGDE_12787 [Angomonas deanei]CAD2216800.1 hypothetical protein, conserved [Angomonas deanei]|eukprot:EPY23510.1 hypothetical protein AGDE_12787 [Angomonas deanei]